MPATFYERYMTYQQQTGSIPFTKSKIKHLHHLIKAAYNRIEFAPITYTDSPEGDNVYQVRLYPDFFIPVIDRLIMRFDKEIKAIRQREADALAVRTEKQKIKDQVKAAAKTVEPLKISEVKKERKRIPIRKAPEPIKIAPRPTKKEWPKYSPSDDLPF